MKAKFTIGLLVVVITSLTFAGIAVGVDAPPNGKINIAESFGLTELSKRSVDFDHGKHDKATENQCSTCHVIGASKKVLVSQKTGKPLDISSIVADGAKNKMHMEFCWECHNVQKVSVGRNCAKCHTGAKF